MEFFLSHHKHHQNSYLYLVLARDEERLKFMLKNFHEVYPKAEEISMDEFDRLHNESHIEVIPFGDQNDVDKLTEGMDNTPHVFKSLQCYDCKMKNDKNEPVPLVWKVSASTPQEKIKCPGCGKTKFKVLKRK